MYNRLSSVKILYCQKQKVNKHVPTPCPTIKCGYKKFLCAPDYSKFFETPCIKGAVQCLPRELTTVREVVYKQCSHMRRSRDTCFNLCPCFSLGGPAFQLGFLCPFILVGDGGTVDNSQSIMSDGCKHSYQYSSWYSVGLQPVSVLAVLLDKWFVLHS